VKLLGRRLGGWDDQREPFRERKARSKGKKKAIALGTEKRHVMIHPEGKMRQERKKK
jgi:hypothetical protein